MRSEINLKVQVSATIREKRELNRDYIESKRKWSNLDNHIIKSKRDMRNLIVFVFGTKKGVLLGGIRPRSYETQPQTLIIVAASRKSAV